MYPSKLSAFCDKIIEAGWLAAAIIAPLFFSGYAGAAADKPALLQIIAATMLAAWLVKWIDQRGVALSLRSPMVLPIVLLLAVNLLATFTSIAPRTSFFGAYQRPQGTYTLFAYLIVFAMLAQGLRTRAQLDRLLAAIILPSFPVAVYSILQHLGFDPLPWNLDFDGRAGAMLGNPIFLAAYLSMVLMLTLGKIFNDARAGFSMAHLAGVAIGVVIAATQFIAIILSNSRGPILSWFVGVVFFLLLIALAARRRRLVLAAMGLGVAGLLFVLLLNLPNSPLSNLRGVPGFARLADLRGATGEYRLFTWSNVARLVQPHSPIQFPNGATDGLNALRPLIGYGPDTLSLVYNQIAPASDFSRGLGTAKSHNDTWDALVSAGILGLLANQFLYFSFFLYGLRWLGFVRSARERNWLMALWLGLGAAGGVTAFAAGQPGLIGLAIPIGNVVAVFAYLARFAWQSNQSAVRPTDFVWLAALLAGGLAHYGELQFGIAVAATQTLFWLFAAMMVVLGIRQLEVAPVEAQKNFPAWRSNAASYAILIALILATLLYEFVVPVKDLTDPLAILWRALSFNPVSDTTSYAILGLLLATWLVALGFVFSATPHESSNWRADLVLTAALSATLAGVFAFVLAMQLSQLMNVPAPMVRLADVMTLADQTIGLVRVYVWVGAAMMLCAAIVLMPRPLPEKWLAKKSGGVALIPLILVTWLGVGFFSVRPLEANAVYALGKVYDEQSDWNGAIALYKSAIRLAPANDVYSMSLGRALTAQSNVAGAATPTQFTAQVSAQDILALSDERTATLHRSDLLYAAQAMLNTARALNPLYLDHTLNLARFYLPSLPIDSPGKMQLVDLAERFYAQANRIAPNDVLVWNEWADFDLTYRNAPDAAIRNLEQSLMRDSGFDQTYLALGKVHESQNDFARAAEVYRRWLAAQPHQAQAASKLAFAYYQQGAFDQSIAAYEHYLKIATDDTVVWEAHKNLAVLYEKIGDAASAAREAQRALQLAPVEYRPQLVEWSARLLTQVKIP